MKYYKVINLDGFGTQTSTKRYIINRIYPETFQRSVSCATVADMVSSGSDTFKLSTKKAYDLQEGIVPKPRKTKAVVDPHVFKVGDKVEFVDCVGRNDDNGERNAGTTTFEYAGKYCTKETTYTVIEVSGLGSIKLKETDNYWFNKLKWK